MLIVYLVVLTFLGCAKESIVISPVKAIPFWFELPGEFTFKDEEYNTLIHPFFDLVPFKNNVDTSVNFVLLNPAGSKSLFEFDLISGSNYLKHQICKEKDVSGKRRSMLSAFPFTEGIIPRLLDQTGVPQTILVFGRDSFYQEVFDQKDLSHRARVVGGIVENFCSEYHCLNENEWQGRLILVAVDTFDGKFRDVTTLEQLKKIVNWNDVVTFLENSRGRSFLVKNQKPAYEIRGEIAANEALEFAFTKGHLFSFEELKTLKTACTKLYDFIWKEYSLMSAEKSPNFTQFFNKIYLKHRDQFYTCSKYVRTSNINFDPDRHWFFTYMVAFFKMEANGYYFGCRERGWFLTGQQAMPPEKRYQNCSSVRLEGAFEAAFLYLNEAKKNDKNYFRYITYDNGVNGGHAKIYSFVDHNGKYTTCDRDKIVDKEELFPDDVSWKKISLDKKASREEVIE